LISNSLDDQPANIPAAAGGLLHTWEGNFFLVGARKDVERSPMAPDHPYARISPPPTAKEYLGTGSHVPATGVSRRAERQITGITME
jgi:hypothetical protein